MEFSPLLLLSEKTFKYLQRYPCIFVTAQHITTHIHIHTHTVSLTHTHTCIPQYHTTTAFSQETCLEVFFILILEILNKWVWSFFSRLYTLPSSWWWNTGVRGQGSGREDMRERNETRGYHARRRVEDLFCHRMLPTSTDEDHANICPLSLSWWTLDRKMHVKDMLQNMLQSARRPVLNPKGHFPLHSLWGDQPNYEIWYSCWAAQARGRAVSCPGHHDPAFLS